MTDYIPFLSKKGYNIVKIFKFVETSGGVFLVCSEKQSDKKYIAKITFLFKKEDAYVFDTEVQALKYLKSSQVSIFVPKLYECFKTKTYNIIIMEYINGKSIFEYHKFGKHQWQSIICQISLFVALLEKNKILHNDLWDANIIIIGTKKEFLNIGDYKIKTSGILVKVIDYQYTHQYSTKSEINSKIISTSSDEIKTELGWNTKFHLGGDLNQFYGIISEYPTLPKEYTKVFQSIVIKNSIKNAKFPYTTIHENLEVHNFMCDLLSKCQI